MPRPVKIISVTTNPYPVGDQEFEFRIKVHTAFENRLRLTCTLDSEEHKFVVLRGGEERLVSRISFSDVPTPGGEKIHRFKARLSGPAATVDTSVRASVMEAPVLHARRVVSVVK
jgi:hypothetical protein